MLVVVVDGLGGGMGKHIIEKTRERLGKKVRLAAVGTNSIATSSMIKAGADFGATGQNAIAWNCSQADVIMGSLGIVLPNSMHGEISPGIALAIGNSNSHKLLIPISRCGAEIAGVSEESLPKLIDDAVERLARLVD